MVSSRLLGLATACATVLTLGLPAERASAQGGEACKAEVITVTGRSKGGVKRWTQAQELEGRGAAMDDAVATWEREVDGKFGEDWRLWTKATDKSFTCAPAKGVLLMGVACTVSGRPCPSSAPDSAPVVAKKREPGKRVVRSDRWDDDRRSGQGWGYRRAMRHQDTLAAIRSRREERAWNRETARQNFLRAERRRAESRAIAREDARQRYLTALRDRIEGRSEYWDWDD